VPFVIILVITTKLEIPRPDAEKYSDAENFIPTSMYTGHVGNRWYTPYLLVLTSIRPTMSYRRFFPGLEEIIFYCLYCFTLAFAANHSPLTINILLK